MNAARGSPAPPGDVAPVVIGVEQLRRAVPGGIGTAASGLLQGLATLSAPVRSGIVLYASIAKEATAKTPGADPLLAYDLPLLASPLPPWLLTRLWEHGRAAPRRRFSLVHATSFQYPPVDAPLVATVHDLGWRHVPEAYGPHGRRWHEAAFQRVVRDAAAFIVPSGSVAHDLATSGAAIGSRPIEVVPWGTDHLPAPDEPGALAHLRSLGVDGPFLLTVSTLEPRKNLGRLIEAYRLASRALPDPPPLLVVGPRGWGSGVQGGDGVVLAGRVSAPVLAALYRRALGFAYVPLHEGFGLPVAEAMAAGTPVLSSDVPASEGATLLVDPTDVDAIRDGLSTLVLDEEVRSGLIGRGSAAVAGRTWEAVARRHLEIWRAHGAQLPS